MASTDVRSLPRNDQLFLGLGALVFIASFLPWYGVSYDFTAAGQHFSTGASIDAWHGWAAFGLVLVLAATLIVAIQLLATGVTLPTTQVSWNVIVIVLDAAGALAIVWRSLDLPSASVPGGSYGLRWGGWILLIAVIAQVIVGAMRFRATGEKLTWEPQHHSPEPPPA